MHRDRPDTWVQRPCLASPPNREPSVILGQGCLYFRSLGFYHKKNRLEGGVEIGGQGATEATSVMGL